MAQFNTTGTLSNFNNTSNNLPSATYGTSSTNNFNNSNNNQFTSSSARYEGIGTVNTQNKKEESKNYLNVHNPSGKTIQNSQYTTYSPNKSTTPPKTYTETYRNQV